MLRKVLLVSVIIHMAITSLSQEADVILSQFFAVQLDETVFLRWTISAGNTCEDTHIERSSDGISYERIGLIGGICGSPDQSITYEHRDTLPLPNRLSYYRLYLGQYGFTSPQAVEFIQYNDQGFLMAPNPFTDKARLAFENTTGEEHTLLLANALGKLISESRTTNSEFIIQRDGLSAGIYFYKVLKSGIVIYSGKIIVN